MTVTVNEQGFVAGLKNTAYEKLQQDKAQAVNDLKEAHVSIQELEKKLEETTKELDDGKDELKRLSNELKEAKSEGHQAKNDVKDLAEQNKNLKGALDEALKALKDSGRHAKSEENDAICTAVKKWIKDVGFRTTKFVKGEALTRFTKKVYSKVGQEKGFSNEDDDHYVSEDEFIRIYEGYIQARLSDRRQYTQTQLQDVARSKCYHVVRFCCMVRQI